MNNDSQELRILKLHHQIADIKDAFDALIYRINDLEVKLDNLRAQYNHHDHPYKPEPLYGS